MRRACTRFAPYTDFEHGVARAATHHPTASRAAFILLDAGASWRRRCLDPFAALTIWRRAPITIASGL